MTKPEEASQTTCTALPQPPVQAPPDLLTTAQAAFGLAVAQGIPRTGHSHTWGLCAQWLPSTGSITEGLQKNVTKPQATQATCTAEHSPPCRLYQTC